MPLGLGKSCGLVFKADFRGAITRRIAEGLPEVTGADAIDAAGMDARALKSCLTLAAGALMMLLGQFSFSVLVASAAECRARRGERRGECDESFMLASCAAFDRSSVGTRWLPLNDEAHLRDCEWRHGKREVDEVGAWKLC